MHTVLLIALVVVFVVLGGLALVAILIWKVLAPRDMFFTFVDEGTCAVIVMAGKFYKALIQWEGHTFDHTFDHNWDVIDGTEPWHPFGGLRFYGIYPFLQRYSYKFRWISLREDVHEERHEEILYSVLLKDFPYVLKIAGAENSEMVPLDFTLIVTARVVNPQMALFAVQDWMEMLVSQLNPAFRAYVATRTFEELKGVTRGDVTAALAVSLADFAADYGVEVKSVAIKEVTPPDTYQKAAALKYEADKRKGQIMVDAEAEKERLARIAEALEDHPDVAKALALEALAKSPATALIPGIAKMLRDIFPG